jgi:hypothetical protein
MLLLDFASSFIMFSRFFILALSLCFSWFADAYTLVDSYDASNWYSSFTFENVSLKLQLISKLLLTYI